MKPKKPKKEVENLLLEDFHIRTYNDIFEKFPEYYELHDIAGDEYGHSPTTYDCGNYVEQSDQLILVGNEQEYILRKLPEPVKRYGTTCMCELCMRTISEMLLDGSISHMYYGITFEVDEGIDDILSNILHTKKESKAWIFLSKVEDGIPQVLPENAYMSILCGDCVTLQMSQFGVRRHEHNCEFPFENELMKHAIFSAKTAMEWKRPPNQYVSGYDVKNGMLKPVTSKEIHAYPERLTKAEFEFLKEMGFTIKKDSDNYRYIVL